MAAGGMIPRRLVLTGSAQQDMLRIIHGSNEPLCGRIGTDIALPPLDIGSVFKLAGDKGWLSGPRRHLTLRSVFGGVPRCWFEFFYRNPLAKFQDTQKTEDWRAAFVEYVLKRLKDKPEGRLYDWSSVGRNEKNRELLLAIAVRPGAMPVNRLPDSIRKALDYKDRVYAQRYHLKPITPVPAFDASNRFRPHEMRWQISDIYINFWASVLSR